jgi:hypothetical protein
MCLCSAKLLTIFFSPDSTIEISGFLNFDCRTEKMKNDYYYYYFLKGQKDAGMLKYYDSYFTRFLHINCALCK